MAEKTEHGENAKLRMWKDRFSTAYAAYTGELDKIGERDKAYHGIVTPRRAYVGNDKNVADDTHHRNIIYELIETQIDTSIPQPRSRRSGRRTRFWRGLSRICCARSLTGCRSR